MSPVMKTMGKVAGGIGLLMLVTSVITLFVTTGSLVAFATKAGLGALLTVAWALTNTDRLANWARTAFFYGSSLVLGVLLLGALFALNFIVAKRAPTWDLTAKKINTLSPQTTDALKTLAAPVQILTFLPTEPPGPREALEALFNRYASETDKLTVTFLDPRRHPDLVAKYQIREGQPSTVLLTGEGAAATHTIVNISRLLRAQDGEQELTNALVKLTRVGVQKVYVLTGHGEWPLDPQGQDDESKMASMSEFKNALLQDGYAPEPLNLLEKQEIPQDASLIIIAGAKGRFGEAEIRLLETYLEQGGRMAYFAEFNSEPGLDGLLAKYGVQAEPGMVADSKVNPQQPYLVISPFFGEHPITKLLAQRQANVFFFSVRALTPLKEGTLPGLDTSPLVLTSPYAWVELNPSENPQLDSGERTGQMVLALAISRDARAATDMRFEETRLVVFGDSEVLANANWGNDFNRNLVLNAVAWANAQASRIAIRPPDRDVSTIELSPERLAKIRLVAMDLFPTLLMGIGLTIWLTRRSR